MTGRRWIAVLMALLVLGFVVPFVLATTGGGHSRKSGRGEVVQRQPAVGETVIRSAGKPGLLHP